ncbi:hypothetical protein Q5752_001762 [Cryptotrichosporon argae]
MSNELTSTDSHYAACHQQAVTLLTQYINDGGWWTYLCQRSETVTAYLEDIQAFLSGNADEIVHRALAKSASAHNASSARQIEWTITHTKFEVDQREEAVSIELRVSGVEHDGDRKSELVTADCPFELPIDQASSGDEDAEDSGATEGSDTHGEEERGRPRQRDQRGQ